VFCSLPNRKEPDVFSSSCHGFSLLELGVVISIISVVAGGLLSLTTVQEERNARLETKRRLDVIEAALQRYAHASDSLPCPAPRDVAMGNALFGLSPAGGCTGAAPAGTVDAGTGNEAINIGSVPVRTLNLPDNFMIDGWGNRFTYGVIKQITPERSLSSYSTLASNGVIQIMDGAATPNQITEACGATVNAYALVSHGKDGNGAFTRDGQSRTCSGAARDTENCDNDITFTDARILEGNQGSLSNYDDMMRWAQVSALQPLPDISQGPSLTEEQILDVSRFNTAGYSLFIDRFRQPYATDSTLPVLSAQKDWVQIVGAEWGNFAIRSNGLAYSWGLFNPTGILGNCSTGTGQAFARLVSGNIRWKKIRGFVSNACGISYRGQLYCWGAGLNGANGVPGTDTNAPYRIDANSDWTDVAATEIFACGLRNGGRLFCWGSRGAHFGDGSSSTGIVGITPAGTSFSDWKKITIAATSTACGIRADDSLYCWGGNGSDGMVGVNSAAASFNTPQRVGTANDWSSIDGGRMHICGVRGGLAFCWGNNDMGQLGDNSTSPKDAPSLVSGGYTDWVFVKAGFKHSCGYRSNRTAWCWGRNSSYELGDGTNTQRLFPVRVQGITF